MRFVETKTPEQQGCLMPNRTRHLSIRQQTSVVNAIRAHLADFGIVDRSGAMALMISSTSWTVFQELLSAPFKAPYN
jgi:transposase